ncbi:MAG: porin [Burkholderiaceae bacterium]
MWAERACGVVLFIAAAIPVTASAADTELRGHMDLSVGYASNDAGGAGNVLSGVGRASTVGLRIRERLAPGWSVFTEIDAGIDAARGLRDTNPSIALGGALPDHVDGVTPMPVRCAMPPGQGSRRTVLGLTTPAGEWRLGREQTPSMEMLGRLDRFNFHGWGALSSLATQIQAFDCNAIRYLSPFLSGVRLDAMVSLDEASASLSASGRGIIGQDAVLSYTAGAFVVAAGYRREHWRAEGSEARRSSSLVGLSVPYEGVTLTVPFVHARRWGGGRAIVTGFGISVPVGNDRFALQYTRHRLEAQGRSHTLGVRYTRFLSRRVQTYVSWGAVRNGAGAMLPLAADNAAILPFSPGGDARAISIGMSVSFHRELACEYGFDAQGCQFGARRR